MSGRQLLILVRRSGAGAPGRPGRAGRSELGKPATLGSARRGLPRRPRLSRAWHGEWLARKRAQAAPGCGGRFHGNFRRRENGLDCNPRWPVIAGHSACGTDTPCNRTGLLEGAARPPAPGRDAGPAPEPARRPIRANSRPPASLPPRVRLASKLGC